MKLEITDRAHWSRLMDLWHWRVNVIQEYGYQDIWITREEYRDLMDLTMYLALALDHRASDPLGVGPNIRVQHPYDRGSGRTTRMVMRAALCKAQGKRPLILMPEVGQSSYALSLPGARGLNPRDFSSAGDIHRLRGLFRDQVFVDHFVWEGGLRSDKADLLMEELERMPHEK